MKDIGKKAVSGSIWLTVSKYASFVMKFGGGIFLARMIAPKYFGQVGFASAIFFLVFAFSGWGHITAILRQNKDIEDYIGTLLTIRVALVFFLGLVTIILSYPVYLKYGVLASAILIILTLSYIPRYIAEIHRAYIEKALLFKRIAFTDLAADLCAVSAACFLAFRGHKILPLVALTVLHNILTALFLFMLAPKPIKPCFKKELAIDFFNYGKFCFLSNHLNAVYDQGGDFCIGAFMGNRALGIYQRAYLLSYLCARIIWSGAQNVMGSVFARLQADRKRLEAAYEVLNSTVLRISLLFCLWLGLTMPDFITAVYGKEWLPVVPFFRMLIPFAVISGVREINLNLQWTAGHSSTVAKAHIFETGTFLALLIPLFVLLKTTGVIIAVNGAAVIGIVILLKYSSRLVTINSGRIFLAPAISSGLAFIITFFSLRFFRIENIFIRLAAQSFYIVLVYFIMMFLVEGAYVKSIIYKIIQQNKSR